MAAIHGLLGLLLLACATLAQATPTMVTQWRYVHGNGAGAQSAWSDVRGGSCAGLEGWNDPGDFSSCGYPNDTGPRISSFQWNPETLLCKRKLDLIGNHGCTIFPGEAGEQTRTVEDTGCQALAGASGGRYTVQVSSLTMGTYNVCADGCMLVGTSDFCGQSGDIITCEMSTQYTGGKCTPVDSVQNPSNPEGTYSTQPTPDPVPPGMCPGTVNGVTVYVPCDKGLTKGSATTTVTSTGSSTTAITKDSQTVCEGPNCTTTTRQTTTVTMTGGSTSGTSYVTAGSSTSVQSADDFCKKNPRDKLCLGGDETTFGGACASGFSCEGDAALCAVARATNELNCQIKGTGTPIEGQSIVEGTHALKDPKTSAGGARTYSVGNLQSVANPYSEACPANQTVQLHGWSFVIPLGDRCDVLRTLGLVFQAVTLFAAAIFVIKGFS